MCILSCQRSQSVSRNAFDVLAADVFIACFLASTFGIHGSGQKNKATRCAKKLNENVWQNLF